MYDWIIPWLLDTLSFNFLTKDKLYSLKINFHITPLAPHNVACVAGVKRWRERGNLGAPERVGRARGAPLLPPPSRVVSRSNSLPLPFRTPATEATHNVACEQALCLGKTNSEDSLSLVPRSTKGLFTGYPWRQLLHNCHFLLFLRWLL